jgi:hypothetical protein
MTAPLEQVKEQAEIVAEAAPAHVVDLKEDPSVLDDLFGDAPVQLRQAAHRGRQWASARGTPVCAGATAAFFQGPLIRYRSIL